MNTDKFTKSKKWSVMIKIDFFEPFTHIGFESIEMFQNTELETYEHNEKNTLNHWLILALDIFVKYTKRKGIWSLWILKVMLFR